MIMCRPLVVGVLTLPGVAATRNVLRRKGIVNDDEYTIQRKHGRTAANDDTDISIFLPCTQNTNYA